MISTTEDRLAWALTVQSELEEQKSRLVSEIFRLQTQVEQWRSRADSLVAQVDAANEYALELLQHEQRALSSKYAMVYLMWECMGPAARRRLLEVAPETVITLEKAGIKL